MPSARPSATATMRTSSKSELDAELVLDLEATPRLRLRVVGGGHGGGLGVVRRRRRVVGRLRSRRSMQEPGLDDLLGARVAPLAHTCALADAAPQVVELGAPDVSAGGDLDALDLR